MKPERLVAACTSNRELQELAWAVLDELGAKQSALLLRERFFVNGDRKDTATILEALSDVSLKSFDE